MSQPETTPNPTLAALAAGARVLMGALLIVAGTAKAFQPVLFYWEATSYLDLLEVGREAWPHLARAALAFAPLEVLVGLALALGWRLRLVFPVAVLLMVLFIVLTGLAWLQDAEMDCGCFGTLAKRSPGEALVEDGVMLALLLFAWRWGRRRWAVGAWPHAPRVVGVGGLLALGLLVLRFAPESERIASSDLQPGVRLTGLELDSSTPVDLNRGAYLVELFSPRCAHCKSAVPKLNEWADTPGIPPIVALSEFSQDSPHMATFVQQMRPRYAIASISTADWMRLTWRHGFPRLAYVEDGVIRRVWERAEMPSAAQLQGLAAQGGRPKADTQG